MRLHKLKTDPIPFDETLRGLKNFEIRYNDRDYQVGDGLLLQETLWTCEEMKAGKDLRYTGRETGRTVTYIMRGPIYGLAEGWVIMALAVA